MATNLAVMFVTNQKTRSVSSYVVLLFVAMCLCTGRSDCFFTYI